MTRAFRSLAAALVATTILCVACDPPPPPPPVAPLQPGQQPLRVMVVGDSFALSVGLGLDHYGASSGQLTVLNAALVGCGFGRGGANRGIGLEREWPPECRSRDLRLMLLAADFRPDVVVVAGGMWDVADRRPEGSARWTHIGVGAYDWYLALELRHLADLLTATGAKVVWTTAPHWDPVYSPALFMGPPPYAEADPGRVDRFNELLRAAVGTMPNVHILDLAAWMRFFPGGEYSPDLRVDGVHLTLQSTDVVADQYLGPWCVAIGRA